MEHQQSRCPGRFTKRDRHCHWPLVRSPLGPAACRVLRDARKAVAGQVLAEFERVGNRPSVKGNTTEIVAPPLRRKVFRRCPRYPSPSLLAGSAGKEVCRIFWWDPKTGDLVVCSRGYVLLLRRLEFRPRMGIDWSNEISRSPSSRVPNDGFDPRRYRNRVDLVKHSFHRTIRQIHNDWAPRRDIARPSGTLSRDNPLIIHSSHAVPVVEVWNEWGELLW